MSKRITPRLTQSINFRDVVVGLGVIITLWVLHWKGERFASLFLENNFFQDDLIYRALKTFRGR